MSYQKKSVKTVIKEIDESKIYLPALQRKFVWGKRQIELLFDSLMRNYPFGTFLFWRLTREAAETYVFYEFLKEYDERSPYNRRKTGAFLQEEIVGVLDGQQRLSSLYIGLMGTHTEKAPYKRTTNQSAYEKMSLYINLLSLPYRLDHDGDLVQIEEQNFEFRFLTDESARRSVSRRIESAEGTSTAVDEPMFWMRVGQVLSWKADPEFDRIVEDLQQSAVTEAQRLAFDEKKRFIRRGLAILHARIHTDELINYFEVAKDELEDILKIFVRVNSGGTVLSKTDLLFSTIVATWDDGRDQIEGLLKRVNSKGDGFNFGNEYLMRCCLVLSDGPVIYKVNSFKADNVTNIRKEWPNIAAAVERTIDILVEFGFNAGVLTSQNATILLAYYLYKGGDASKESKEGMRKYLIHSLLKGIYGSAQDQLISDLRSAFRVKQEGVAEPEFTGRFKQFSFEEVLKIKLPQQKTLSVSEDDIERLLSTKKGAASFWILSLLYPHLRFQDVMFHQDHIHPAARFEEGVFKQMGIPQDDWNEWLECRDCLPNLQLMEGRQNSAKNATPFKTWFDTMGETERASFARANYLPSNVGLEFEKFREFYGCRREILRTELRKVLAIGATTEPQMQSDWSDRNEEFEESELEADGVTAT